MKLKLLKSLILNLCQMMNSKIMKQNLKKNCFQWIVIPQAMQINIISGEKLMVKTMNDSIRA